MFDEIYLHVPGTSTRTQGPSSWHRFGRQYIAWLWAGELHHHFHIRLAAVELHKVIKVAGIVGIVEIERLALDVDRRLVLLRRPVHPTVLQCFERDVDPDVCWKLNVDATRGCSEEYTLRRQP